MAANKSISAQFNDIKKEVSDMMGKITKELSQKATEDLKATHKKILDDFYSQYTPHGQFKYNRTGNLRNNSIEIESPIQNGMTGTAEIIVSSSTMNENYNISKDNVFDLAWNKGVRGLPKVGTRILSTGDVWHNPTWQSKYGERKNVFRTSVALGGYTSMEGTPHQVMKDITEHWKEAGGESACDEIASKYKN